MTKYAPEKQRRTHGLWRKEVVAWTSARTLYLSVSFTWLVPEAEKMARSHKGPVVAGGPGITLLYPDGCDWAETPASVPFDVLSMHNPLATFTTRGCPNSCAFCAVPRIEGGFRELDTWKAAPIVCDNNLLAASKAHFRKVIESLRAFPETDFNQGLEAARFTTWRAEKIRGLKMPHVRFAMDTMGDARAVRKAVATARAAGLPKSLITCYVLFGFRDTPEKAKAKLEAVREMEIRPTPMRYQPLDALERNAYVAPGWSRRELLDFQQYYWNLRWTEHVAFEDFSRGDRAQMTLLPRRGHVLVGADTAAGGN